MAAISRKYVVPTRASDLTRRTTLGVTPVGQAVLVVFRLAVSVPLAAFVVGAARLWSADSGEPPGV